MKQNIHPTYHTDAAVSCACGNKFTVGSTKEEIRVELCNKCHPFYTGKQKFVDTARRVEKFQEKAEKIKAAAATRKGKKAKRAARAAKKQDDIDATAKPKKVAKKAAPAEDKKKEVETPTPAPVEEAKTEEAKAEEGTK